MIIRPAHEQGDVMPILSRADMLQGAEAVAALARDRLELLSGEWWEDPARGNALPDMLRETRLTEADGPALAAYLTSYIRQTSGVREIREVSFSVEGRQLSYACVIDTDDGEAQIDYSI